MSPNPRSRLRLASLFTWHRYVGLVAALFVIALSASGLLLNHTETLRLDERHVRTAWILDWYGIEPPTSARSVAIGTRQVTLMEDRLYLDTTPLPETFGQLIGAVAFADMLAIAVDGAILLLTQEGELIERLDGADGVPAGMRAIGQDSSGVIVVRSAHGYYRPDADLLHWSHWKGDQEAVTWARTTEPQEGLRAQLAQDYRGRVLPWERVVLDLHSGRVLGSWGILLTDLAAVFMIFLAVSGLWLWVQRLKKRRAHRHKPTHTHHGH